MEKLPIEKKKCLTPEFRVSFPQVFKAKSFNEGEAKYSVTMLFDKKTDLTALKRIVAAAAKERFGAKEKWPKNLRLPFADGNEKQYDGYKDTIVVRASSKLRPQIVDKNLDEIISEDDFYAGCYARAELVAFGYDTAGNKGVSFVLNHLQKLRDGQKFSGRKDAVEVFDKVEDASDDPESYSDSDDDDDDLADL